MRLFLMLPILATTALILMSFHLPNQVEYQAPKLIEYPARPVFAALPPLPALEAFPVLTPKIVRMKVTACSPGDPLDAEYYKANGYEGALNNIAADLRVFPRGTQMRVPGYMDKSAPGKFWIVDSAGGSIIRRSARQGIIQIDVKFRTHYSAVKWGSKMIDVEVITPAMQESWQNECAVWEKKRVQYLQLLDERGRLFDDYQQRCRQWSETCAMIRRANERAIYE